MMMIQDSSSTYRKSGQPRKSAISQAMQAIKRNNIKEEKFGHRLFFSVVTSEAERSQCLQLAYQEYLKKSYVEKSETEAKGLEIMKTLYDDAGRSVIFKAEVNQVIIGTVTINWDSELGLPLDREFPEVGAMFKRGIGEIAEVTRLAIKEGVENSTMIINGLFNAVTLDLVAASNYKCLLIEVNPRHQFFYKKKMLFKPLIESRPCQRVSGAPAVLLRLDREECLHAYLNAKRDEVFKRTLYVNFNMEQRIIAAIKLQKKTLGEAKNEITF